MLIKLFLIIKWEQIDWLWRDNLLWQIFFLNHYKDQKGWESIPWIPTRRQTFVKVLRKDVSVSCAEQWAIKGQCLFVMSAIFKYKHSQECFKEVFKSGTCLLCAHGQPPQKENLSVWMWPQSRWKSPIALQYPQWCITMGVKGSNDGDLPGLTGSHSDGDCQKARDKRLRNNNGVHKQPRPSPFCRN